MNPGLVAFAHDPWIGKRFAEQRARVLVVGESHYMAESGTKPGLAVYSPDDHLFGEGNI